MKKDMLSKRLEAITKAKPVTFTPPEKPKEISNERSEDRRSAYKFAKVFVTPERSLDSVILDLHAYGARVKLHGAPELPNTIVLVAPEIGLRKRAKVIWQDGEECGLEFAG